MKISERKNLIMGFGKVIFVFLLLISMIQKGNYVLKLDLISLI